eukprot:938788-Pyramimonas_sp.AAC.2
MSLSTHAKRCGCTGREERKVRNTESLADTGARESVSRCLRSLRGERSFVWQLARSSGETHHWGQVAKLVVPALPGGEASHLHQHVELLAHPRRGQACDFGVVRHHLGVDAFQAG